MFYVKSLCAYKVQVHVMYKKRQVFSRSSWQTNNAVAKDILSLLL